MFIHLLSMCLKDKLRDKFDGTSPKNVRHYLYLNGYDYEDYESWKSPEP